ncbi:MULTISPECIES: ATP-binding protein [Streptosporangium]|uniref:Signal transduction histidine kinase/phage shock protein PspC (Stress-responsive transcriptional regulator) n=1 Tax=Streptosporangium brasiliense TaxID=47480 RepID=A0ABT9R136_9ACTN|nr:ATP-binding protein [Streptosporangium brasiliense]MDP9862936.1 signal transduction histidine kinase/phage shock protein PspC (stress-responsive transcriptional regulator) [Streptosporangium brasiliense]
MAERQTIHDAAPATSEEPASPRLMRPVEGRLVAGVAQGAAAQLGLDPVVLRLAFVLLTVLDGIGTVAYAALWMFTPREPYEGREPDRDWSQLAAYGAVGLALMALGWLTGTSKGGIGAWPIAVGGIGSLILWQQADPDRRRRWMSTTVGQVRRNRVRTFAGLGLVVIGAIGFLVANNELSKARSGIVFTLVVVGGVALIAAPWLAALWKELQRERRERIRQEERAEMAAHVHDSVLHTLTLIQRNAHDSREVTRLARSQERELRNWLYQPKQDADASVAAAVRRAAAEEEDTHGVPIEVVCVGDHPLTPELSAMMQAARQAMVNAAKYSESSVISVYAEAEPEEVVIFVRDRGVGFDMEQVPVDRMGIRQSIIGRMERHGGSARVRAAPGEGTEVMLTMKLEKT